MHTLETTPTTVSIFLLLLTTCLSMFLDAPMGLVHLNEKVRNISSTSVKSESS